MMQQLSLSIGAGTAALALHLTLAQRQGTILQAADFQPAYLFIGGIVMVSSLFFLGLKKDAGANVSGNVRRVAVTQEIKETRSR
jgi:hypothetical protein